MPAAIAIAEAQFELGVTPERAAHVYVPGCLIRSTRVWPPGFVSQGDADPGALKRQEAAVRGRATQLANGHTGSMRNGLSRKSAGAMPDPRKAVVA